MSFRVLIVCDADGCEETGELAPSGDGGPGVWEAQPFSGETTTPVTGWIDDSWCSPDGWKIVRGKARCPTHA